MKQKKLILTVLLVICLGVFAFSAYKIGSYWMAKVRNDELLAQASSFVDVANNNTENTTPGSSGEEVTDPESLVVDFDSLYELSDDVVGWIYCPGTPINYPIVQGYNNDYYLYRLIDGTWNANGSIFMDYRNSDDFSDSNTMIHGHHMKTGAMFASLMKYKTQSYYDEHPYMYIYTPEQNYRMDLFAGAIVSFVDKIYSTSPSASAIDSVVYKSTFDSPVDYEGKQVVTLSTCTFEYDNSRYVILGTLNPID